MSSIFRIVSRLFRSIKHQAILDRLRAANPSCTILSVSLHNVRLGQYAAILDEVYLNQVYLGNFSYVSTKSCLSNVTVGNFCSIGPHVQIGLAPHPSKIFVSTYPAFYSNQNAGCPLSFREDRIFDDSIPETRIAHDVWIGSNVIIPGGIQVGTGAILAAGSVVVNDVPSYAVVGGNPAKVIRYRFHDDQIKNLVATEWWNWPIGKIRNHLDDFSDIEIFLARED